MPRLGNKSLIRGIWCNVFQRMLAKFKTVEIQSDGIIEAWQLTILHSGPVEHIFCSFLILQIR